MSEITKPEGGAKAPPDAMKLFALSLERFDRALDEISAMRGKLFGDELMAAADVPRGARLDAVMRIRRFDNVLRLEAEALVAPRTAAGIVMAARTAMIEALVDELEKIGSVKGLDSAGGAATALKLFGDTLYIDQFLKADTMSRRRVIGPDRAAVGRLIQRIQFEEQTGLMEECRTTLDGLLNARDALAAWALDGCTCPCCLMVVECAEDCTFSVDDAIAFRKMEAVRDMLFGKQEGGRK